MSTRRSLASKLQEVVINGPRAATLTSSSVTGASRRMGSTNRNFNKKIKPLNIVNQDYVGAGQVSPRMANTLASPAQSAVVTQSMVVQPNRMQQLSPLGPVEQVDTIRKQAFTQIATAERLRMS